MRVTAERMRLMVMAIVAVACLAGVGVAFAQAGDPNAAADPVTVETGRPQAPVENAEGPEAAEQAEAETEAEADDGDGGGTAARPRGTRAPYRVVVGRG